MKITSRLQEVGSFLKTYGTDLAAASVPYVGEVAFSKNLGRQLRRFGKADVIVIATGGSMRSALLAYGLWSMQEASKIDGIESKLIVGGVGGFFLLQYAFSTLLFGVLGHDERSGYRYELARYLP